VLEVDALRLETDVVRDGREHGFQRRLADGPVEGGAGMALGYAAWIGGPELVEVCHLPKPSCGALRLFMLRLPIPP
jgi:hypothetical protein